MESCEVCGKQIAPGEPCWRSQFYAFGKRLPPTYTCHDHPLEGSNPSVMPEPKQPAVENTGGQS